MTRFEKIILSITGGSHLSVHALMLALPSLIPIIRNEFNDDTGGSHTAAYFSIRFNSSVASNLNIVLENEQFYRAALEADEG